MKEKCGLSKPFTGNFATEHGIKHEPTAISLYEKQYNDICHETTTYVVQVMQAGGQIKCGDATGEYIARPTLIESTSTEHIYHGVEPWLRSDALSSAAQPQDETFCGLYGDSLAANKLVVTQAAEQHPDMPLHDGFCVGHQLSI